MENDMNFSVIKKYDIANGPGCRTTLFVSGCRNRCEGCFQPETWSFSYGQPYTEDIQEEILDSLSEDYVAGLTLLGGDPFEEENQQVLTPLLEALRARFGCKKDVWAYTGYIYEKDLPQGCRKHTVFTDRMLGCIDVLVDGPFIIAMKDISLRFCGSSNQRLLDMKKTLASGVPVRLAAV